FAASPHSPSAGSSGRSLLCALDGAEAFGEPREIFRYPSLLCRDIAGADRSRRFECILAGSHLAAAYSPAGRRITLDLVSYCVTQPIREQSFSNFPPIGDSIHCAVFDGNPPSVAHAGGSSERSAHSYQGIVETLVQLFLLPASGVMDSIGAAHDVAERQYRGKFVLEF